MLSNFRAEVYVHKKDPRRKVGLNSLYLKVFNLAYARSAPGHFKNVPLRMSIEMDEWGGGTTANGWFNGTDDISLEKNRRIREALQDLEGIYWKLRGKEGYEPHASLIVETYRIGLLNKVNKVRLKVIPFITTYCDNRGLAKETRDSYLINFKVAFTKFLQLKYNTTDICMDQVDTPMFYRFELYMTKATSLHGRPYIQSTIQTYMDKFCALVTYAYKMGEIDKDPGEQYLPTELMKDNRPVKAIETNGEASFWQIKKDDIYKIEMVTVESQRAFNFDSANPGARNLGRTRLLFLLQTWTGLSFVDLNNYKDVKDIIRNDMNGRRSIIYNRFKTRELAIVPLFPQTLQLLEALEYNISTQCEYDSYNMKIKNLIRYYCIKTDYNTTHVGRHVFGSRMLTMGFTMEAVSRMMGHSSIRETEKVYARIDITKIYADYDKIRKGEVIPEIKIAL